MPTLLVNARETPVDTGRRLATAFLGYFTVVVAVITLVPFTIRTPPDWRLITAFVAGDFAANIALFLPIGFLTASISRARGIGSLLKAAALGFLLSLLIEYVQEFMPERIPAAWDLVANTLGATIGAGGYVLASRGGRGLDAPMVERLALDLPLAGLVYLMVPLTWLTALAHEGTDWALGLTAPLGLMGAIVISSVQREGLRRRGAGPALLATAWFASAVLAGAPDQLLPGLALIAAVGGLTALLGNATRRSAETDRRYEPKTLATIAPIGLLWLAALAGGPLLGGVVSFDFSVAPVSGDGGWSRQNVLRLVEQPTAFAVLGYAIAQWIGRRIEAFATSLAYVLAGAVLGGLIFEIARGVADGYGASLVGFLLSVGGAAFGCAVYHLQLGHLKALRDEAREQQKQAREAAEAAELARRRTAEPVRTALPAALETTEAEVVLLEDVAEVAAVEVEVEVEVDPARADDRPAPKAP
ncbi:MAG: VanZ family protein [Gemmatimonadales bacterium]|nr:VanZ family protein [Gemmatimonadales bacterium]